MCIRDSGARPGARGSESRAGGRQGDRRGRDRGVRAGRAPVGPGARLPDDRPPAGCAWRARAREVDGRARRARVRGRGGPAVRDAAGRLPGGRREDRPPALPDPRHLDCLLRVGRTGHRLRARVTRRTPARLPAEARQPQRARLGLARAERRGDHGRRLPGAGGGLVSLEVLGLVPARGGSRRVPRKNLAEIDGRSLVARALDNVLAATGVGTVALSSDDNAILEEGARFEEVHLVERPPELATDKANSHSAVVHALAEVEARTGLRFDAVALVQCTSPFTEPGDIDGALELMERTGAGSVF